MIHFNSDGLPNTNRPQVEFGEPLILRVGEGWVEEYERVGCDEEKGDQSKLENCEEHFILLIEKRKNFACIKGEI